VLYRGQIIVKIPVDGPVTQDEIVYTLTPDAMTLGVKVGGAYARLHATPPAVCTPQCIDLNASRAAGWPLRPWPGWPHLVRQVGLSGLCKA
jgi:hypothetical protein